MERLVANTLRRGDSSQGVSIGSGQERVVRLRCPRTTRRNGSVFDQPLTRMPMKRSVFSTPRSSPIAEEVVPGD